AIAIAERWPSAMLFVRCLGGVSHHPAESVTGAIRRRPPSLPLGRKHR
ncbi:hypothetical protein, partial [Klebsiella pneumoniae]